MKTPLIIPTAEPFFFQGNRIGCLLVHGFTGTPKEMLPLGEYLAQKGLTVLGIRLAGHATDVEDIKRSRWWDWLTNIEDGLNMLKHVTDTQYIMGLSMGGILTLIASSHYSIAGSVVMCAPYTSGNEWEKRLLPVLKLFMPAVPKGASDWQNPEAEKVHVSYPYFPTAAVSQYLASQSYMHKILPQVKTPTLLIYSKKDYTALADGMKIIYDHLGTDDKEMILLENSGHIITREPERERVFEATYSFIQRIQAERKNL